MKIETRIANENDVAAIAAIGRQSFADAFGHLFNRMEDLQTYLDYTYEQEKLTKSVRKENNIHFLALVEDKPVGFLKMKRHSLNEQIGSPAQTELQKIYVLKEYHGSGAGKQLMKDALNTAEEINPDYIWLDVHISNAKAIHVYKKNGFIIIGRHFFTIGSQTFEYHLMAKPIAVKEIINA
jgi:ribosomal protein S18 acetylase RimI-like enzyme